MAVLLMLQTVVDEGLGACFFGPPADKVGRLLKEFGVPAGFDLVGVLSVGYRAPDKRSPSLKRGRRTTAEVVHRGHWGSHTA
jgi:nitroreductase